MTLILRTMKKHMGWEDAKDDYVVLDGDRSVGRIYKEIHGGRQVVLVNQYKAVPSTPAVIGNIMNRYSTAWLARTRNWTIQRSRRTITVSSF
jgi:hypothetical protein